MDRLEQAVRLATDPAADSAVKADAISYCEQFKAQRDSWIDALTIFVDHGRSAEFRFFGLKILEEIIRKQNPDLKQRQQIKSALWTYVTTALTPSDPLFIRTKLALVIVLIAKLEYPELWPSFFHDLIAAYVTTINTPKEPEILDIFLKICAAIHEEIVDLLVPRTPEESARNTHIKDSMREEAVYQLVTVWFGILKRHSIPNIVNLVLKLIGEYVSWVDIKLFVEPEFAASLSGYLANDQYKVAACECLTQLISKGMKPEDKLTLIQSFNVISIIENLSSDDQDFKEQIANLVDSVGCELCKVWENAREDYIRLNSFTMIMSIFPRFLALLSDEYDDISSLMFPLLSAYLGVVKKIAKSKIQIPGLLEANASLVRAIIFKMKYDAESFIDGDEEDDAMFQDLRKTLKGHFDSISLIYPELISSILPPLVCSIFNTYGSGGSVLWSDAELALHLTYLYGESNKGIPQYMDNPTGNLSSMGEILSIMMKSNISAYPHQMVQLAYFEVLNRYWQFFDVRVEFVPQALESFVDVRGLHHPLSSVKSRAFYLFLRFIKNLRPKIAPYVETVLVSCGDLLAINEPSAENENDGLASMFDSQLYLFEAVGMLISLESIPEQRQFEFMRALTPPIIKSIGEVYQKGVWKHEITAENRPHTQHIHNLIMSLGAIAKGFPDYDTSKPSNAYINKIFSELLNGIIVILENMSDREPVRNAVRFTFQRMVGCMGPEILSYINPLFKAGLFSTSSVKELVEFINFLGLTNFKFKKMVFDIVNAIFLPLMERIFYILNQTPSGTDEAVAAIELRKAYLGFLSSLFSSELDAVFTSEANGAQLSTIIQSVVHYVQDTSDNYSQKLSFSVLNKFIIAWGGMTAESIALALGKSTGKKIVSGLGVETLQPKPGIPGFDAFIYETIVPLAFSVPQRPGFNINDGQSILMLNEIASLHKAILLSQGIKYLEFLKNVFLPKMNYPETLLNELVSAIRDMDPKDLRKVLKQFLIHVSYQTTREQAHR